MPRLRRWCVVGGQHTQNAGSTKTLPPVEDVGNPTLCEQRGGADVFDFQDVFGVGVVDQVQHGASDLFCG